MPVSKKNCLVAFFPVANAVELPSANPVSFDISFIVIHLTYEYNV